MKRHMSGWGMLCTVLGSLVVIAAVMLGVTTNFGAMVILICASLPLFAAASVCCWMDDLLETSDAQMKKQSEIADALNEMRKQLGNQTRCEENSRREEQVAKQTSSKPGTYDAAHEANIYRRSQRRNATSAEDVQALIGDMDE